MGFFGRLIGGGRSIPRWARGAFGTDLERFDAFVDVVATVLEGAVSTADIRSGSIVLDQHEWILHEVAQDCARADAGKWRAIVERSYRADGPRGAAPSGGLDELEDIREQPSHPWIIGTTAWGGVMFECGDKAMVLVLLPIVDRPGAVPDFPPGLIKHVVVCNSRSEGHLVPAAIAKAAGVTHVYAIEPSNIEGVEAKVFDDLRAGPLRIERAGTAVFGHWNDGTTFLCGDAIPLSEVTERMPRHLVGKVVVDDITDTSIDWLLKLERAVIVANVPGIDADALTDMFSKLGVSGEIVNKPTSRRMQVLALMIAGQLTEADKLATEAIAAGDGVADMYFQRAMIALMRGDEATAETMLSSVDTPQALTSRANIAARRNDPNARQLVMQALAQLPGDAIAISVAIHVHALLGDRRGARALLTEHGQHLDPETRVKFDLGIDGGAFEIGAHRFPEHAQLAVEAVKPMLDAGQFAAAEPMLRRAHEWDPANAAITADLGFALSQQKRDSDAIALYDAVIERGGSGTLLKFNRGNCRVRLQCFAEAANDFRACVEIKEDWHDARVNLVSALFASNDKASAERELAQLKKLGGNPQHIVALEQMLGM